MLIKYIKQMNKQVHNDVSKQMNKQVHNDVSKQMK